MMLKVKVEEFQAHKFKYTIFKWFDEVLLTNASSNKQSILNG